MLEKEIKASYSSRSLSLIGSCKMQASRSGRCCCQGPQNKYCLFHPHWLYHTEKLAYGQEVWDLSILSFWVRQMVKNLFKFFFLNILFFLSAFILLSGSWKPNSCKKERRGLNSPQVSVSLCYSLDMNWAVSQRTVCQRLSPQLRAEGLSIRWWKL